MKNVRPGSDLEKEMKTVPWLLALFTIITLGFGALYFLHLGHFNEILRENVAKNYGWQKVVGIVCFIASAVSLWLGWLNQSEGKVYMWTWGLLLTFGALFCFGFDNM